jgi:multicomponent Na+:H+ antiporter subunit F
MVYTIAIVVLFFSMPLVLFRAFKGKTPYDRILATNIFGSLAILLICLLAGLHANPFFLDIALLYALINFIASIGLLRYFTFGSLHHHD